MNTVKRFNFKKLPEAGIERFRHMKIRFKLAFSYIAAVAIFILVLSSFYYFKTGSYIKNQTSRMLHQTVKQAKSLIDYKVGLYNNLANTIYVNTSLQDTLFNEYTHPFDRLEPRESILGYILPLKSNYSDISKLSLIVSNHTVPEYGENILIEKNIKTESWYLKAAPAGDNIQWSVSSGIHNNEPLFMTKKLKHRDFDSYLGFLKIEFNPHTFFSGLDHVEINDAGWFDITDNYGNAIYSGLANDSTEFTKKMFEGYKADLYGNKRSAVITIDREDFMAYCDTIEYTGWNIIYTIPLKQYSNAITDLRLTTVIVILLCIVLFIAISWLMASGFTSRITELSRSMKKIQVGNFDVHVSSNSDDEVGSLINGFNKMAVRLKRLVQEVYEIKIKEKEAELIALQAQINPHFLYNTLASISWLGMRNGCNDVTKISNSLAKFYKLALNKGKSNIRARDELEHVKAYMSIQNIRFSGKINMVFSIDESIMDMIVPKLILQPFIENSIIHGIWKNKSTITIRLVVKRQGDKVVWKIIDDGVGMDSSKINMMKKNDGNSARGYGVINVDQRLKLYYGDSYGASLFSKPGIGTVVSVVIPYQCK